MTGWRCCVVRDGVLRPATNPRFHEETWLATEVTAACYRPPPMGVPESGLGCYRSTDGRVPGEDCTCGLHFFGSWAEYASSPYRPSRIHLNRVAVRLEVLGKTLKRRERARERCCERARIRQLVVSHEQWLDRVQPLAAKLDVPVVLVEFDGYLALEPEPPL